MRHGGPRVGIRDGLREFLHPLHQTGDEEIILLTEAGPTCCCAISANHTSALCENPGPPRLARYR